MIGLCGHGWRWRTPAVPMNEHECINPEDHDGPHRCYCGATLTFEGLPPADWDGWHG